MTAFETEAVSKLVALIVTQGERESKGAFEGLGMLTTLLGSNASFLKTVKKHTDIQELTQTILNELVEKIIVYQTEGTGKGRTQRLEIHYNFDGILDTPEVACSPQSVMIDTR